MQAKPFTLDTVLDYRQQLEDIAKNNLAQARAAVEAASSELARGKERYQQQLLIIEQVQQQGVAIGELIRLEEMLTYLKDQVALYEKQLKKCHEQVARARKELMKKAKERQVMEKLKERQNAEWRKYLSKKEAAMLDEIAIIFHNK